MEGNFGHQFQSSLQSYTSAPVLYTTLIFSFSFVQLQKHSQPRKKCIDETLLDQFYTLECLKGFIFAVWPKNYPNLSKDGKLTLQKKGCTLSSFLNFLRPFRQVSRLFDNLFSWKCITSNSVWLCRNIFKILKLISIFWRHVLCVFSNWEILRKCKKSRRRLKLTYKPA